MLSTKYKKIFTVLLSIIILSSAIHVFAANPSYTALEPKAFPGMPDAAAGSLTLYLGFVFDFGIAIAVTLAFIMLIYGGIMKMTTDSWQGQDTAKTIIENAISGLGLALISWVLLNTINPNLVNFKDNIFLNPNTKISVNKAPALTANPVTATTGSTQTTTTTPVTPTYVNTGDGQQRTVVGNSIDSRLNQNVYVRSTSDPFCYDPTIRTCTNTTNLPPSATQQTNNLSATKACNNAPGCITITGGAETGHQAHNGTATVDLAYSSQTIAALTEMGVIPHNDFTSNRNAYVCEDTLTGTPQTCGTGTHIHVQY